MKRFLLLAGASMLMMMCITLAQARRVVYYEPTVKDIIRTDCGRCHSGPTRNLTDYDSLKMYANSGMLATMVQGPMARFAGNDAQTILDWVDGGALEKAGAQPAHFTQQAQPPCPPPAGPGATAHGAGNTPITYDNTIKDILKKDCLRCHSGPFRNLTTYKNVKIYVDNGLLKSLVRLGGPMHRFAGPDSRVIVAWVNDGAPK